MIAFPRAEDATSVATSELRGFARVLAAVIFVLVAIVTTIIVAVTGPESTDALAVCACELVVVTGGHVSADAHLALVDRDETVRASASCLAVAHRMTTLCTAAIIHRAYVEGAVLAVRRVDLQQEFDDVNASEEMYK